ncbi:HAD family hydrolase [Brachybacterium paraconglomeratum]|uniref:HAD family hydrolase n=1 Tax=Brachybacterium paraconglomeratum TaxID=173362 RepID=UPI0021A42A16|nr:HAD-IA family hydrolase [Brachybacterium paraconglomeratum]MCT1909011.1 HAD-IA family hydrolase [Brachybacterium paraconglomeratum]
MRALIWDLGGTLVDTYPDVDRALAGALRAEPDQELLHEVAVLTRRSSSEAITELAARHEVTEARLRAAYEATKEQWARRPPPLKDGAREVLAAVRERGGLDLVATHRDRASAAALLAAHNLEVDDMVCAPDGHLRKPAPDMVLDLLARHGLTAGECLAVGDRPADVEAARAAGVEGVLLETPGIPLEAPGARRIHSLRDLIPLL